MAHSGTPRGSGRGGPVSTDDAKTSSLAALPKSPANRPGPLTTAAPFRSASSSIPTTSSSSSSSSSSSLGNTAPRTLTLGAAVLPSPTKDKDKEWRKDLPDRRAAFQRYAEHASDTFRSELYHSEQPRQLLVLSIGVLILIYVAFSRDVLHGTEQDFDERSNAQAGLLGAVGVFCVYAAVQFRDSLMVRPHPMMWRIVHALGVVYFVILAALFVQSLDGARKIVRLLSPEKIADFKPLDAFVAVVDQGKQCEISFANFYRQLSSPWMLSHFLGWFGKMIIFRDFKYMMICSGLFELVELTLQFVIPEFKECWWDSVFMDFLGANTLGIIAGSFVIKFLNRRKYEWMDEEIDAAPTSPARRALPRLDKLADLIMPFSWSEYRWQFFSTFERLIFFGVTTFVQLALDLNSFFLLHSLQIPVNNKMNHFRLLLIAFLAVPSVSEWYEYVDGKMQRLGPNTWLLYSICVLELLLIVKMGLSIEQFHRLPPMNVWLPWLLCLLFCSLFVLFYYLSRLRFWLTTPYPVSLFGVKLFYITRARVLALLHACAVLPLLALAWHWKY